MKQFNLTFLLIFIGSFLFVGCSKDADMLPEVQNESVVTEQVNKKDPKATANNNRGLCDNINYVLVGVYPAGTVEQACQIATCAAWYDLEHYYDTYTIARPKVKFTQVSFTPDIENFSSNNTNLPTVDNTGSNPQQVLTNTGQSNYQSYLTILQDNFNGNSTNDAYWNAFIGCYTSIVNP